MIDLKFPHGCVATTLKVDCLKSAFNAILLEYFHLNIKELIIMKFNNKQFVMEFEQRRQECLTNEFIIKKRNDKYAQSRGLPQQRDPGSLLLDLPKDDPRRVYLCENT